MGFPVVETTATTNITAAADPWTINLPTGIQSGNLLTILLRVPSNILSATFPTGWVALVGGTAGDNTDASDDDTFIRYKQADGTEGATMTVDPSSAAKACAIVYRISGAEDPATQAPEVSTIATGTSTTPDPTTVTPTGGAKDYLWLWLGGWEGEQTSPPAGSPINYSNPLGANTGTAGAVATNCRVASAQRTNNAASEDPGSWTISASDDWSAWAMAIHPAAPAVAEGFGQRIFPVRRGYW